MKWLRILFSTQVRSLVIFSLFFMIWHADGVHHIKIGAIFHEDDYPAEVAFTYAIQRFNMYSAQKIQLEPSIHTVSSKDSFKAGKIACNLASEGVAAIFGPGSMETRGVVESTCQALEIPNIQTYWSTDHPRTDFMTPRMTLNFHPEQDTAAQSLADLVEDYNWKGFSVLYEDYDGLARLQNVLKRPSHSDPITVKQLKPNDDNRPLFKELKQAGETHIIIDCAKERVFQYLQQANDIKLMEEYQVYILTGFDHHTIDFVELKHSLANVTSLRMVDPTSYELRSAVNDWQQGEMRNHRAADISPESVLLSTALTQDAVNHFGLALEDLINSEEGLQTRSLSCDQEDGVMMWEHGLRLIQQMKIKTSTGLTGEISFDSNGRRTQFLVDIVELSKSGFKKIGFWDLAHGINYTRTQGDVDKILTEKWQNKTFIVSSRLGKPYLMDRTPEPGQVLVGNDRYEGYSMDLIDGIAKILNISYRFELVPDKKYGSYNKVTKKWDGLVKQLLDLKADLAICDLTITYERKTAVDFTMPFMNLGVSILYSKPKKESADLFSFLKPLSLDVWIYMGTAYLGVSILLFVLARMATEEWLNPHPCNKDPDELENTWNFLNCIWLVLGSLMAQGCDLLPKAVSTRMVAGMWWFFTLIMISSYTANLAAFLTNDRKDDSVSSAEDLSKQSKVKYGAVLGGSTGNFFKDSNFSIYQRMWTSMESTRPSVFVKDNEEGMDRVLKGKRLYAFLMESTSIQYMVERNCDLMQVGGQLDTKGYGIAMPVNSPYRTAISGAVLKMQEEGKMQLLKTKWWEEMYGGPPCDDEEGGASSDAKELGIENVGGVFVVLGSGVTIAVFIAIMEFVWNVRQVAIEEQITVNEAFWAELKFVFNFKLTTKPVHNKLSESSSSHSSHSKSKSKSGERHTPSNVLQAATSFMRLDKIF